MSPFHLSIRFLCATALAFVVGTSFAATEAELKANIAAKESALGPEHPDVARALSDLADFYQPQARLAEMQALLERAVAIQEKARGEADPDVLTLRNNLAFVLKERGRFAEAEAMHLRTLAAREKALGPEHADVAATLNNLATLYLALGRYAEAEATYQRDIAIVEKALGPEHVDLAVGLANLATVYTVQARFADAEPLLRRSLALLGSQDTPAQGREFGGEVDAYDQGRVGFGELLQRAQDEGEAGGLGVIFGLEGRSVGRGFGLGAFQVADLGPAENLDQGVQGLDVMEPPGVVQVVGAQPGPKDLLEEVVGFVGGARRAHAVKRGGTGFVLRNASGGATVSSRCACLIKDRGDQLLRLARIPRRYAHCTLENFEPLEPALEQARVVAREWVDRWPDCADLGLLFLGPPGTGKTHLAVGIARELSGSKGARVLFYEQRDLLKALKGRSMLRAAEPRRTSWSRSWRRRCWSSTIWEREGRPHGLATSYMTSSRTVTTPSFPS